MLLKYKGKSPQFPRTEVFQADPTVFQAAPTVLQASLLPPWQDCVKTVAAPGAKRSYKESVTLMALPRIPLPVKTPGHYQS